jgi:hypothetical protein
VDSPVNQQSSRRHPTTAGHDKTLLPHSNLGDYTVGTSRVKNVPRGKAGTVSNQTELLYPLSTSIFKYWQPDLCDKQQQQQQQQHKKEIVATNNRPYLPDASLLIALPVAALPVKETFRIPLCLLIIWPVDAAPRTT